VSFLDAHMLSAKENRAAFLIGSYIVAFDGVEISPKPLCIGGSEPAGFFIAQRAERTGGTILLQETELDHLELQVSHGTDDLHITGLLRETAAPHPHR
jgi:hypothetical protein